MTDNTTSSQVGDSLAPDELTAALLEITGDLDKAQVVQENLPAWMIKAEPQVLQALERAYADSRGPREKVRRLLARLQPLDSFCAERLKVFLQAKGLAALDIDTDLVELPRRTLSGVGIDLGGMLVETVDMEQHSLLQAAMQNFSQASAEPGGTPRNAVIRVGAKHRISPDITVHSFVGYCRELDLGKAYQAHIGEVFNLPSAAAGTADAGHGYNLALADIGRSRCADMQVDLHVAHAKGDIDAPTCALLLELVRADMPAMDITRRWFNNQPLTWQGINIDGACLWSVLVFSSTSGAGPLVVYMPNEPIRPWYRYESMDDFKLYLSLKLHVKSYRRFFQGYLDESERFGFFERFDKVRTLGQLALLPVTGNLSAFFFNAYIGKIQLDARVLAVPNAQADDDARRKRVQDYMDAGLTLLNVAAFVVPVLGQLMMGVAIGQILGEVYEGIEDWLHDDKAEALDHLINIAENIAAMVAFALGAKVVGRLWRGQASSTSFFDKLEAVRMPDQDIRLWRARSEPYRQSIELDGAIASPTGVYQVHGQSFVRIDGAPYSIAFDSRTDRWRVQHPQRPQAYRPPVTHNRQGGWQFTFERPEEWRDPQYILGRLDPTLTAFPRGHLRDIAAITDANLPRLQQLAKQNLPLPERVRDCARRFKQNQNVRDLLWQMEHQPLPDASTARVQMLALPLMDGWPKGRFFELLDDEGYLLERHPDTTPFDYEDLSIHLTTQQLHDGHVMPTVLAALDPQDTAQLLGGTFEPGEAQEVLAKRLLASLKKTRQQVFEKLYEGTDFIDHTDHGQLKTRYSRLPIRVAWEVMTHASTAERWQMRRTGRIPLRVSQRAREALAVLEEDAALSGLYLPELAVDATRRLATGLLRELPGWPQDLMLQLRQENLRGAVLAQVGDEAGAVTRTVVQSADGYRAFDAQGTPLGRISAGTDGFYQALLDTLSVRQQEALGLSGTDQAEQLRQALIGKAQDERSRIWRYLWPERARPDAPETSCIQAMRRILGQQPAGLVRKVRKLYPLFDELRISNFLQGLGSDHLSRAKAVRALEQQYELLKRTLKLWCQDRASLAQLPGVLRDYRLSRYQAAQVILRCWQYAIQLPDETGNKVPSLSLDGMAVGKLPMLPPEVQFEHIRQLSLKHMALNDDVAYFIRHFKGLRNLDMSSNQLTRLPEVLSQMQQLQRLQLADNKVQLTEYSRGKLADLRSLTLLDLSNNPLVDAPVLSKMFELRHLSLRNCRLTRLPSGFLRIPYLDRLDLRENDITTLPAWLFDIPRDSAQIINLRQNPLELRSRVLLRNYRNERGVGMGYLEDDIPRLNEQTARDLWMPDARLAHYAERNEIWMGLKDEPGSDALFKLLAELGGAADSTHVREDMDRRIWRVLKAAAADVQLREEVFERAATPLNCDDAGAVSFSNLEILVEIHDASRRVESGAITAKPLLKLARGLFRLDQLERLARSHSSEHPTADPLEVSLAYRTGLVGRFHLPGQPRHMRFASLGGVTEHMLEQAETNLKVAELSPQLLKYLVDLPFWNRYLKRTFSGSFDALQRPFDERMQAVFDQGQTLKDAAYRDQMRQISQEQSQAERKELERLTLEQLELDEKSLCALPPV